MSNLIRPAFRPSTAWPAFRIQIPAAIRISFLVHGSPYSSRYHPKPGWRSGLNNDQSTRIKEKGSGKLLLIIPDTYLTDSFPRLPSALNNCSGKRTMRCL
jgi:hypothetical protein